MDRSGFNKRPAVATARSNPGDPGEPGRDPIFFFQMWDLKLISIYTLCSQEKRSCFFNVEYKIFWFKYFNLKG